ncbi:hypothetical protein COO91_01463 [Nostoc flagelliforme CCNUN1]|uniref:Uncharacterized protein n=1 Tax=Nostoc flagelliforme CCNUN1 TaxID=2038116 RepID=A0A2K8SJW0_9NOSO|nr:hypothetical protein COO91_01463 [Nostoc flagelliforme CCNUN1]
MGDEHIDSGCSILPLPKHYVHLISCLSAIENNLSYIN